MLTLLLSGCGFSDQLAAVKQQYIDPALEQAESGVPATARPSAGAGPNVLTDRTKLTDYAAGEAIFSRLSSSRIDKLVPDASYGRLLSSGNMLLTTDGTIVLDDEYEIEPLSYVKNSGDTVYLDMYVLYDGSKYALCGADGSWATDFSYSEIIGMPLGALCVVDLNANSAVCYSKDGSIAFNTANFAELSLLAAGSVTSFAEYSSSYMRCEFSNGQCGYISTDGSILNRNVDMPSYFDSARSFSEGLAAVNNSGVWGYIGTDGVFVINRTYSQAGSFRGGIAAVVKDGVWSIINKSGEVKKQFPNATEVVVEDGYVTVDGEYYSSTTLEPAVFYGYEGTPCDGDFWVRGEAGVRIFLSNGNQVYFSGAAELLDRSGELWSVVLADGTQAVMDANSRVTVFGETSFVQDVANGETYIWSATDGQLYSSSGVLIASDSIGYIVDGYTLCQDGFWQGWKTSGDEWVFRVPTAQTD